MTDAADDDRTAHDDPPSPAADPNLVLERLADPRYMQVEFEGTPPRRLVCRTDAELAAILDQAEHEAAERDRLLRQLEDERAWREPVCPLRGMQVDIRRGSRCDIVLSARRPAVGDTGPRRIGLQVCAEPEGIDPGVLRGWLDDGELDALYLVVPGDGPAPSPEALDDAAGRPVAIRARGWTRAPVAGRFDPLAIELWAELAGHCMALREDVVAPPRATFKKRGA